MSEGRESAFKYYQEPFVDVALHWRHNDDDSVSNHQPHACILNRLFRHGSKKTSKPRVTGLCAGNSPGPVNSPHKEPVTRKMFPFDDVIMGIDFHQLWDNTVALIGWILSLGGQCTKLSIVIFYIVIIHNLSESCVPWMCESLCITLAVLWNFMRTRWPFWNMV